MDEQFWAVRTHCDRRDRRPHDAARILREGVPVPVVVSSAATLLEVHLLRAPAHCVVVRHAASLDLTS
eukprot:5012454-Prymnesium_polylepis.1